MHRIGFDVISKTGGDGTAAKNWYNLGHFVGGYNILLRIE
jgi:hypothetical protein